jgi:hypothetical protein
MPMVTRIAMRMLLLGTLEARINPSSAMEGQGLSDAFTLAQFLLWRWPVAADACKPILPRQCLRGHCVDNRRGILRRMQDWLMPLTLSEIAMPLIVLLGRREYKRLLLQKPRAQGWKVEASTVGRVSTHAKIS